MADTIASPLISCLCDRLSTARFKIWEKNLSDLMLIKAMVLDEGQVPEREMEVKKWLKEVSDVAYQADDLLDEFELYIHNTGNKVELKVINFLFPPSPSCFRLVLSLFPYQTTTLLLLKLRRIEVSLVQLVHKHSIIRRRAIYLKAETEGVGSVRRHLGTVSSVIIDDVKGRNKEKETLVGWLLENSYKYPFSVVEIVGMGGIGKTTLAQLVYNNDLVRQHFEFMAWVCVSQQFDVMRIAREILEAAIIGSYIESLEVLGKELIRVLRSKRFLIVLDDVWAEIDDKDWSILTTWLGFGALGSKVLLTSRSSKVAAFPSEHRSYFLGHLSHEDSWSVFQRHASLDRYKDEEVKDKIFKGIVAKCKGLPLAVKTLAVLMRLRRTEQECLSMVEIDVFQLPAFQHSVLRSLGLSYNHLPPHLKPCFAFCSVFPKGCSINKEKLIQFWISNHLLGKPRSKRGRSLEKIGSDCFEELVERSFFMDVSRDEYGDLSTKCQMHDLIHELALSVAGNWCSVVETGTLHADISDELHHSSLVSTSGEPSILQTLHQAKNLRTLLLFSFGKLDKIPTSIFQVLRCLRVLDLSQTGLCELPVSVGHLIHLRYLDLSHTYIKVLPRSIAKLKYLQTLRLVGCSHLPLLPKAISKLLNLRNLDIRSCCLLSHMPCGIGKLRLLQTLPTFLLSETDSCGNLRDLGCLNLRGRLEIKNLEHVRNLVEADDANLHKMVNICSLGLSWGAKSTMGDLVIEKLRPSQNVEVLDITGYRGFFPPWLYDKDSSLVKLSLINCYCDALPPLGQLPHLRHLHVKGLSQVQFIGSEFYGNASVCSFKSLKQLEFYDMPNLVKWENSEPEVAFPLLETLSIKGCLKLAGLPLLPKVRKIALSKCSMMLLESLANLASLDSLVINDFRDHSILSLKLGSLNSIRTLTVYNCDSLIYPLVNGIQEFNSLEKLSILYCKELKSLPTEILHLTSLRKLEIIGCQDLVEIPIVKPSLYYLQELTTVDCPNLPALPEDSLEDLMYIDRMVVI